MQIDMIYSVFFRQRVHRALQVAAVFWIVLTALLVACGTLLQIGAPQ